MNRDRKWILAKAKEEADGFVCVGGLVHAMTPTEPAASAHRHSERLAFAKLIQLNRRKHRLSSERLAELADVELAELVAIECGEGQTPEPRTVHQLARVLGLPAQKLMQLSGLVVARDERLVQSAVRFAARSESIEKLTPTEQDALDEFVKILAEA